MKVLLTGATGFSPSTSLLAAAAAPSTAAFSGLLTFVNTEQRLSGLTDHPGDLLKLT